MGASGSGKTTLLGVLSATTWCARPYLVCLTLLVVLGPIWCAWPYLVCLTLHGALGPTWCAWPCLACFPPLPPLEILHTCVPYRCKLFNLINVQLSPDIACHSQVGGIVEITYANYIVVIYNFAIYRLANLGQNFFNRPVLGFSDRTVDGAAVLYAYGRPQRVWFVFGSCLAHCSCWYIRCTFVIIFDACLIRVSFMSCSYSVQHEGYWSVLIFSKL